MGGKGGGTLETAEFNFLKDKDMQKKAFFVLKLTSHACPR